MTFLEWLADELAHTEGDVEIPFGEVCVKDLNLVSTEDLIKELSDRHKELIVIREHKKRAHQDNVFVKTSFGKKGREDKGFDLVEATEMLHATHWQLIHDYLDDAE